MKYLLIALAGARVIKSMTDTFHGRHPYANAFAAVAYGLGPLFLLRLLVMIPALSPWIAWGIGILLSIGVLYTGLPRMMEPDPPHAFGLYLTSSLTLLLCTGLVALVADLYFRGSFPRLESLFSGNPY